MCALELSENGFLINGYYVVINVIMIMIVFILPRDAN